MKETDLVVVGGGPGGYTAAFYAADKGLKVLLVDRQAHLGGVCLHVGCIPSKALLHLASFKQEAERIKEHGLHFDNLQVDLEKVRGFKDSVITKMSKGLTQLAKARKVEFVQGHAAFTSKNTIEISSVSGPKEVQKLRFKNAIVATGSSPIMPTMFGLDSANVMDSSDALELKSIPKKLFVVGGGVIGLELGSVYASLGSEVHLVEALASLNESIDKDLFRVLERKLTPSFSVIHTATKVTSVREVRDQIELTYSKGGDEAPRTELADAVLVCVGRKPNSSGIGLGNTKIQLDELGRIQVNKQMKTHEDSIYAIGDVAPGPMLAHKASREGHIAVDALLGEKSVWDHKSLPSVIYTDPELAWTGLTEFEAQQKKIPYKVASFPWAASGRASAMDRNDGLTKILFEPRTEKILGVGIVGLNAGELIAEGCLAVEMSATVHDLTGTIHAHPTLSETVMETAEALHGMATHIFLRKR